MGFNIITYALPLFGFAEPIPESNIFFDRFNLPCQGHWPTGPRLEKYKKLHKILIERFKEMSQNFSSMVFFIILRKGQN
jgi:hypothetical protein